MPGFWLGRGSAALEPLAASDLGVSLAAGFFFFGLYRRVQIGQHAAGVINDGLITQGQTLAQPADNRHFAKKSGPVF
jgi:hypothetical protein